MPSMHKTIVCFDLDDTLYKEIDYLKSAYHEIADYLREEFGFHDLYGEMFRYYREGKDVFQEILDSYMCPVAKKSLIKMYRGHKPHIGLDADTKQVLDSLHQNPDCTICMITDGRSVTQWNKIKALGLDCYQKEKMNFLISEEHGHIKPDSYAYELIESFFPDYSYIYVGDNPQKDFLAPNKLGWKTACLLDDGRNIHKQDFELSEEYLPKYKISDIKEIIKLI